MAAVGLILPGLTRILPWVISLTALCLMVVVGSATVLHFFRGETDSAVITTLLFVLCGFIAYMRWRVKPIAPRAIGTENA